MGETVFLKHDDVFVFEVTNDMLASMVEIKGVDKNDNKSFLQKPFVKIVQPKSKYKYNPTSDATIPEPIRNLHEMIWGNTKNGWDTFVDAPVPTTTVATEATKTGREVAVENTTRNVSSLSRKEERRISKAMDGAQFPKTLAAPSGAVATEPVQKKAKPNEQQQQRWTADEFIEFAFTPAFREQYIKK